MIHKIQITGNTSICGEARRLLSDGVSADDTIALYRDGMLCVSGIIGKLAKYTLSETAHGRPTFMWRKWHPFEMRGNKHDR